MRALETTCGTGVSPQENNICDTGDCKPLWPDSAGYLHPEPVKSRVSV